MRVRGAGWLLLWVGGAVAAIVGLILAGHFGAVDPLCSGALGCGRSQVGAEVAVGLGDLGKTVVVLTVAFGALRWRSGINRRALLALTPLTFLVIAVTVIVPHDRQAAWRHRHDRAQAELATLELPAGFTRVRGSWCRPGAGVCAVSGAATATAAAALAPVLHAGPDTVQNYGCEPQAGACTRELVGSISGYPVDALFFTRIENEPAPGLVQIHPGSRYYEGGSDIQIVAIMPTLH